MKRFVLSLLIPAAVALTSQPADAFAGEGDFFAGVDALAGIAEGSSSTTDGGAPGFGGRVSNVEFGTAKGLRAHLGYQLSSTTSLSVSYQYLRSDVSWDAEFPLFGVASEFDGTATSNAVMGHVGYTVPLSPAVSVTASAGLGVTFNTLSDVVEHDTATGIFLADVANNTKASPIAQIGADIRYQVTPAAALGLTASLAHSGSFETGTTRSGNLGVTDINRYRIEDVYRANLGVSFRLAF